MDTAIITTIITAATTLIVSMGTWHLTAKTAREKEQKAITELIESYRDELRNRINQLEAQVTQVNATVQQQIALVEVKIDTLSQRVEKHNNVIERTYRLEQDTAVIKEQIADIRRDA